MLPEMILAIEPARRPPQIPNTIAITTNKGIIKRAAVIFGIIKYDLVLIPMISNASICSLTLIFPNSLAILLPATPASTIQTSVGANSRITVSRTICAIVDCGINGLTNW